MFLLILCFIMYLRLDYRIRYLWYKLSFLKSFICNSYRKNLQFKLLFVFAGNIYCRKMSSEIDTAIEQNEEIVTESKKRIQVHENEEKLVKKQKVEMGVKIKKRNFAMMLGYLGKNYYGMQRNPGFKTVEESLINALYKSSFINSEAFEVIQTIQFQRAARTDKGVSAARQVVSLKLRKIQTKSRSKIRIYNYLTVLKF